MDKDIQAMFRQKNREILIQNLELDIERNFDILVESLTNLFNLQFDIAQKNIFSMYKEDLPLSGIANILIPLKKQAFLLLSESLENKRSILLEQLKELEFEKDQMDEYYRLIFNTTEDVLQVFKDDKITVLKKETIENFGNKGKKILADGDLDIIGYRIRDYIMDRLFGKLEDKVKQELFIRDNNLSNKGKESYEKFQELERKTTKI